MKEHMPHAMNAQEQAARRLALKSSHPDASFERSMISLVLFRCGQAGATSCFFHKPIYISSLL